MLRLARIGSVLIAITLPAGYTAWAQTTDTIRTGTPRADSLFHMSSRDTARYHFSGSVQDFLRVCDSLRAGSMLDSQWAVKVITHDELMRYYHEDFADLLWEVAGIYVHDLGSFGKPISASMNGLSNEHLLVLIDGVPLNDPDISWTNLNLISLEHIERVEIYSGNYSPLYGSGSSAGVIHIVSRMNQADKAMTSIKFRSVFSPFQDIGVYFGRNLSPDLQFSVGGSYKETPGEQNILGFSGGYLQNMQRTRYKASQLNAGLQYRIDRNWGFGFWAQRNRHRFDAYGPNRFGDNGAYSFLTKGGLRKDDRSDYCFNIRRADSTSLMESRLYFINTDRTSRQFSKEFIPSVYPVQMAGIQWTTGKRFSIHRLQAGGTYEQRSIDGTVNPYPIARVGRAWIGDQVILPYFNLWLSAGLDWDSRERSAWNASAAISKTIHPNVVLYLNSGITTRRPSLNDNFFDRPSSDLTGVPAAAPSRFLIVADTIRNIARERLYTGHMRLQLRHAFWVDRALVAGYYNYFKYPVYMFPQYFAMDTVRLVRKSGKDAAVYGLTAEAVKQISIFSLAFRPSIARGPAVLRNGLPDFYARITGSAAYNFFNDNMKLYGHLAAMYFSSHPGYSFQDAPQMYYYAPRRSGGGWIFSARASAYIGDLQLFYEAENILRARFTLMDGYDITPQQWRFGVIWKLYN